MIHDIVQLLPSLQLLTIFLEFELHAEKWFDSPQVSSTSLPNPPQSHPPPARMTHMLLK